MASIGDVRARPDRPGVRPARRAHRPARGQPRGPPTGDQPPGTVAAARRRHPRPTPAGARTPRDPHGPRTRLDAADRLRGATDRAMPRNESFTSSAKSPATPRRYVRARRCGHGSGGSCGSTLAEGVTHHLTHDGPDRGGGGPPRSGPSPADPSRAGRARRLSRSPPPPRPRRRSVTSICCVHPTTPTRRGDGRCRAADHQLGPGTRRRAARCRAASRRRCRCRAT